MRLRDINKALDQLGEEIRNMRLPITRCRYLGADRVQCTGEALDASADVLICARHAGEVMALVSNRIAGRAS